jgi:RNA recognition motif-containing protein
VKDLCKTATEDQVRRVFARFGKISSFNLVNKDTFPTNIAFVAYYNSENAKLAFDNVLCQS